MREVIKFSLLSDSSEMLDLPTNLTDNRWDTIRELLIGTIQGFSKTANQIICVTDAVKGVAFNIPFIRKRLKELDINFKHVIMLPYGEFGGEYTGVDRELLTIVKQRADDVIYTDMDSFYDITLSEQSEEHPDKYKLNHQNIICNSDYSYFIIGENTTLNSSINWSIAEKGVENITVLKAGDLIDGKFSNKNKTGLYRT